MQKVCCRTDVSLHFYRFKPSCRMSRICPVSRRFFPIHPGKAVQAFPLRLPFVHGHSSPCANRLSDNCSPPMPTTLEFQAESGSLPPSLVSSIVSRCDFCSSGQRFALWETFQLPKSGFLQILPHGRHPCLRLTLPTAGRIRVFHPIERALTGHTPSSQETAPSVSWLFFVDSPLFAVSTGGRTLCAPTPQMPGTSDLAP